MPEESQEEPKLIVDEDWKEQVQREKEMAAKGEAASEARSDQTSAVEDEGSAQETETQPTEAQPTDDAVASDDAGVPDMPPASFDFLVTTLATQAMMAMGQIPGPEGKQEKVQKPIAKHYIDLLGILEEKTKGNLEVSEQKMLGGILHELRMIFVRS